MVVTERSSIRFGGKKRDAKNKSSLSLSLSLKTFFLFFLTSPASNLRLEALLRGLRPPGRSGDDRKHRQVLLPVHGEAQLRGPRVERDRRDEEAPPAGDDGDDGEGHPDREHEEEDGERAEQALDDPVGPQRAQEEDGREDPPQAQHQLVAAREDVRRGDARRRRAVPDPGLLEDAEEGEAEPEGAVGGEGGGSKGVSGAHLPLAFWLRERGRGEGGRKGRKEREREKERE